MPKVKLAGELEVRVDGKVVARIVTEQGRRKAAHRHLAALRKAGARILGDVITPINEAWDAGR